MRVLIALASLLSIVVVLPAQDKTALGGREWKVVKSEESPPGTKLMFTTDGKVTLTFTIEGKSREVAGTYALAGNQLTLKLNHDGRERVETRTIKKLTDTVLITEDKNRKVEELAR